MTPSMKRFFFLSLLVSEVLCGCAGPGAGDTLRKIPVGLQLYSVRTDLEQDFYGTLRKVRDMGYAGVEFYGEYYGHTPVEVKAMCTELGLIPFSNHVPFQQMMDDLDRVIEENTVLGVQYIVFPYMDKPSRPGVDPERFKATVARIGEIGAKVRQAGFQLLYHNHDFEFVKLPDGTVGHDYIFSSNAPEDVQVELDVCWSDFAGFPAPELLRKYDGRVPVVHLKDYFLDGELSSDPYALIGISSENATQDAGKFEFRPLGEGGMDMRGVLQAASDCGARWLCVEQDEPTAQAADRFEGPRRSAEWLRKLGLI